MVDLADECRNETLGRWATALKPPRERSPGVGRRVPAGSGAIRAATVSSSCVNDHMETSTSIPTEPIGSIPRPKYLLDALADHAALSGHSAYEQEITQRSLHRHGKECER